MRYDIIIVGGGMVGAAMACALQPFNFRVALIDATEIPAEDHRLIALNHSSFSLFNNLGIWSALAPHAAAIEEIHVSNAGHFGTTRLNASEIDLTALGYVVPAKNINAALYANLNKTDILRPATLTHLDKESVTIEINSKQQMLETSIIIAADGTHSTVRKILAIPTETIDYKQKALVTVTELQRDHQNIAYERFQSSGAIAMLPLVGQRVATIWSDDEEKIAQLMQLSDEDFLAHLQKQFGYRLGRLKKIQQRFTYPLKFIKAKEFIKDNAILIGNAAHTLHPIAAQGLNLALHEIAILADFLSTQAVEKLSLVDFSTSFNQQKFSMNLSHKLTQLFSADFFLANTLRQTGMIGLDLCTTAKRKFVLSTMGKTNQHQRY